MLLTNYALLKWSHKLTHLQYTYNKFDGQFRGFTFTMQTSPSYTATWWRGVWATQLSTDYFQLFISKTLVTHCKPASYKLSGMVDLQSTLTELTLRNVDKSNIIVFYIGYMHNNSTFTLCANIYNNNTAIMGITSVLDWRVKDIMLL